MGDEADQIVFNLLERAKALATKALPDAPSNSDVMELFQRLCMLADLALAADEVEADSASRTVH